MASAVTMIKSNLKLKKVVQIGNNDYAVQEDTGYPHDGRADNAT